MAIDATSPGGLIAALFVVSARAQSYTACAPGRYGSRCEGACRCSAFEDCDDGITGDGTCTCALGYEAKCGHSSAPLVPSVPDKLPSGLGSVGQLLFVNQTLQALRQDVETLRHSRQVWNASLSRVAPVRWKAEVLRLALFNPVVAERLGLASSEAEADAPGIAEALAGRRLLPGSQPFANAYGGHQFGNWAGQLGDGRAISLGDAMGFPPDDTLRAGARSWPWEVTLKGAGRTPYSRGGDGRAALANAAREFFAPIYLEATGVPAVGTLSVVASDEPRDVIVRDEWYDGNVAHKKPGIVARVAPSFLRFGSVQLAAKRQGVDGVSQVARFALDAIAQMERHDDGATSYLSRLPAPVSKRLKEQCFFERRATPSCAANASLGQRALLRCFLERVTLRTAALIAAWASVGFAHGIMNTDNLSVLGITVDMNVYGFLASYDESWAPNHIDDDSRYAFGAQRDIAAWNLRRFADALTGTAFQGDREADATTWATADKGRWLSDDDAGEVLREFGPRYDACYAARMELKLGLPATGIARCGSRREAPGCLIARWISWLKRTGADLPRASRGLAEVGDGPARAEAVQLAAHAGVATEGERDVEADAEMAELLELLRAARRIAWADAGASASVKTPPVDWRALVRAANPAVAPRSHILREASRFVEAEDSGKGAAFLESLQRVLREPFDRGAQSLRAAWDDPRAAWRGVGLGSAGRGLPADVDAWLRDRLGALPPPEMRQLRTSCGAQ